MLKEKIARSLGSATFVVCITVRLENSRSTGLWILLPRLASRPIGNETARRARHSTFRSAHQALPQAQRTTPVTVTRDVNAIRGEVDAHTCTSCLYYTYITVWRKKRTWKAVICTQQREFFPWWLILDHFPFFLSLYIVGLFIMEIWIGSMSSKHMWISASCLHIPICRYTIYSSPSSAIEKRIVALRSNHQRDSR